MGTGVLRDCAACRPPASWLYVSGTGLPALLALAVFGPGIHAGAFLLAWAAEVAERDISASLVSDLLALLTVPPEYAIKALLA